MSHTVKEAEVIIAYRHPEPRLPCRSRGTISSVSLYKFRGGFKDSRVPEMKHKLSASATEDMIWWRRRLQSNFVGMKIIHPLPPLSNTVCVDASTSWGIGLILDGRWLAWEFKGDWKSEGREIGWAEMVAIELALRTLIRPLTSNIRAIIDPFSTSTSDAQDYYRLKLS